MATESLYLLAADALLILHALVVAFITLTVPAIYAGRQRAWGWVRNIRLRLAHLAAMAVVVLQAWLGALCPLTTWEMLLRERAGAASYEGSFIRHWLQALIYYDAPAWVFVIGYTLFAALVAATWFIVPPRRGH